MEETLESSYNSPTKKAAELELERMKKRLADAERRVRALTEEASEREREMSSTSVSKGVGVSREGDDVSRTTGVSGRIGTTSVIEGTTSSSRPTSRPRGDSTTLAPKL